MVFASFKKWIMRRLTCNSPDLTSEQAHGLPSFFVRLPPELVQLILDHLPNSSLSSLALCSRNLLVTVGLPSISPESEGALRGQWTALLLLLERDLPDHIFCKHCRKLHRTQHLAEQKRSPWYQGPRLASGRRSAPRWIIIVAPSYIFILDSPLIESRWP